MSNNKRTPPPYHPSFVTPPPSNRNLYGASSQSSQGTEVLSQATEVLSNEEDLPPTPHLSQENAGAASATPGASSLKKTNAPGFRGNPVYTNAQHRYMFRPNLNDPSQDYPSDVHGNRVPFNDPRRNASRHVDNVEETIANLSSATPLSRRNVTARAAASASAAEDSEPEAEALFSPAASRSSVLSLTPHRNSRPPKNSNSPRRNTNKKNHNRNKIGGKRRTYRTKRKQHKQRKQRKGTQRTRKQSRR
jgi:hypothetical protein